jgi:hypothetical protein
VRVVHEVAVLAGLVFLQRAFVERLTEAKFGATENLCLLKMFL